MELIQSTDELTTGKYRSENAIKLMFHLLAEYELTDIAKAITEVAKTRKFTTPIQPADIIEQMEGSAAERSAVGWRVFLRAVERMGYYDSVRFPHPAYHYVVEQLGGWQKVSEEYMSLTDKELQFREKQWRQLFELGMRIATWENTRAYLPGFYEIDNGSRGFAEYMPPILDTSTGQHLERQALSAGTDSETLKLMADVTRNFTDGMKLGAS